MAAPGFQRLCMRTVGRENGQSDVLHRAADREVIERLELEIAETEHLVHRVVEEAVYTCGRDPAASASRYNTSRWPGAKLVASGPTDSTLPARSSVTKRGPSAARFAESATVEPQHDVKAQVGVGTRQFHNNIKSSSAVDLLENGSTRTTESGLVLSAPSTS